MNYIWTGINSGLILLGFAYVVTTNDINRNVFEKSKELEKRITLQEERCDHLSEIITKKDTITINIKNYNYNYDKPTSR